MTCRLCLERPENLEGGHLCTVCFALWLASPERKRALHFGYGTPPSWIAAMDFINRTQAEWRNSTSRVIRELHVDPALDGLAA